MAQTDAGKHSAPHDLQFIVGRMQQVKAEASTGPVHVLREYLLAKGDSGEVTSQVLAQVDYDSHRAVQYSIQKTTGSSRGEDVVKRVLDHEVSAQSRATAITDENYYFEFAGQAAFDGSDCYLLRLNPKRKDSGLISGQAWVDQRSFQIRHIAGELVKTPSWWLKNVSVEITFGNVEGRWMQTRTEASADVRMAGARTLKSQLLTSQEEGAKSVEVARNSGRRPSTVIPAEVLLFPLHKR
ncbi:MAG TPA: hypothetical protein VFA68_15700 [Terriglobales bacterium]|nr:hypothetical protein [Terriglobales bacterium]